MSITDELREWMRVVLTDDDPAHAIADRIDAEHEEKVSYWQGACYEDGYKEGLEDNEGATAKHGWVKLPVDADGEVIHIGDRVENNERVVRIVLTDGSWEPSVYVEKLPNVLHEYFCNEISHYHEPTVEDVLLECCHKYHSLLIEDMNDAIAGVERDYIAPAEIIAEYAAKLRLRSDAE